MRLWVRLLDAQAAEPTALQWLPLLACWLSDSAPAPPSSAPSPRQPLPITRHADGSNGSPQQQPNHAQAGSPARPATQGSPAQLPGRRAGSPGEPAGSPARPASSPGRPAGSLGRAVGSPGSDSGRAGGHAATAAREAPAAPLARSVEEALQLQEAATRIGYGAAALPLWEAFLARYLAHQARHYPWCPRALVQGS